MISSKPLSLIGIYFLIFLISTNDVNAYSGRFRICGRRLAEYISTVCDGKYPEMTKKSTGLFKIHLNYLGKNGSNCGTLMEFMV